MKKNEYINYPKRGIKKNLFELKKLVNSEVDTPDGKATLSEIYVTELGFIMAKIYYPKTKIWVNHKIGELNNLLKDFKLSTKSGLMRKIKVDFKKQLA